MDLEFCEEIYAKLVEKAETFAWICFEIYA